MIAKKVKVKVEIVSPSWSDAAEITRTKIGDVLEVQGLPYGGNDGNPVYYVVKNTDGLTVCLFEDEVEVISE